MSDRELNTDVAELPWGPLGSSGFAKVALVVGVFLWAIIAQTFNGEPETWDSLVGNKIYVLPVLAWGVSLIGLLLRKGHWLDAFLVLPLSSIALFANVIFVALTGEGLLRNGPGPNELAELLTIPICLVWVGLGWLCFLALMHANGDMPNNRLLKNVRIALGLVEIVLVVLAIAFIGLYAAAPTGHGYTVRNRVSELILAASSAKTALSEGMQTTGSWSPIWMSSITISPAGMVARATIGPTGQITVYGTSVTSDSIVTLTPTITTDNKLVWRCTGSPSRYMPASCR